MNITFRIAGGDADVEALFVSQSKKAGMVGLKGHRLVYYCICCFVNFVDICISYKFKKTLIEKNKILQ